MATKRIGYAVVGLGSISKVAVLPAFARSKKAKLVALVSGNKQKARKFAKEFKASAAYTYDEFDDCLKNPEIDAVYIATPPGVHEKHVLAAARAGKHVLCEKPLAATATQARNMVEACERYQVKFMTAYRKYLEPSTVTLKKMISKGELGRIDVIHSLFTELHQFGDNSQPWLFSKELSGGGPLTDLGVYCINTCRWLLGEDPSAASAVTWVRDPRRYQEVEEGVAFRLDFPSGIILQSTTSYSGAASSFVHVHGEKGWAALAPAFAFEEERRLSGKIAKKWFARTFKRVDEFALELDYFAGCVRQNRTPEPDGEQGRRDIVIIEAIYRAARTGRPEKIEY